MISASKRAVIFCGKSNTLRHSLSMHALPTFASVDPWNGMSEKSPHVVKNLVNCKWKSTSQLVAFPDPLTGSKMLDVSEVSPNDTSEFISSLNSCLKSGLHNPFKNPERYIQYGSISAAAAAHLKKPNVSEFFIRLIQRVAPKHYKQAYGEVSVTQKFIENFSGDQVRFLARSFSVPGDHTGQMSSGYRFPYGPVVIIAPFNFPLEIPVLQLLGALYMGNKVLLKVDSRVSVVMEQMLLMLQECGLPLSDVDFINCDGPTMHKLLLVAKPRLTQFTGSSQIAELLSKDLHGKVKIEDAGWDWKILGPDVSDVDHVAWVCDQDAYAFSGQKCSAQSALFVHENWTKINFIDKLKQLASRRSLSDLSIGPVLTVTNRKFQNHLDALLSIPGASLAFGGNLLTGHNIPACYGSFEPTAVHVPIEQFLNPGYNSLCMEEIFGPFQIVVGYKDAELPLVLRALEGTHAHLTAAIVSNDLTFQNKVLSATINGTTYCGIRARTTGAPQNHWFGPAGDPRAAGIGSPEAIRMVWSCHREIITDVGPVIHPFVTPPPS